ncbi:MAG: MFS transporter [Chloroflexota bacterium]|nr:MFS transporter [Chloroflexota bacterium]MDE2886394.1 MFS transporter [Chloroflexota bacterium]
MQASIRSVLHRYGVALQYADFRWIWLGSVGGQSAYWALIVARGIYVDNETGSAAQVGIVTFVAMAPRFILPPLAGYLADRFDRRAVLSTAYSFQLSHAVVLTALALTGLLEVWHVVVLALLNGSFRTFQMTATQTLIPNVVPREHWLNAIAMNQVSQQGSRLFGPGLIAPALLLFDVSIAFLVSTTFYMVGIAAILSVRTRSTGELTRGSRIGASLWAAMSYAWSDAQLRALFILLALHCSMSMSFESMLPILARDVLGDVKASAYLMMGVGAGALVGVIGIAGLRSASSRGRLLLIMGAVSGASMLLLAVSGSATLALLGTAAMGGSQAAFMAIGGAMVQSLAPDGMRGRISGLNQINIGGTMALMNLVNGFAADRFGAANVLLVLGLGFTVVVLASLAVGTVRGIYRGAIDVPARAAA